MSESFVNPIFGEHGEPPADVQVDVPADVESEVDSNGTGDHDVDAVLASLDGLDDLPVADHVAVFEQAHETLRRTLAGARPDLSQGSPAFGRS